MFNFFRKRQKIAGIDPETPISDVRYAVIDTELTGLDERKDSIVSLGAIRMTGGRIELAQTFSRLVSPATALKADSVVIHEITPADVEAQPVIDTPLQEFVDFCGNDVLVGHFVSLDLAFLNRESRRIRGREIANPALDTVSIYEWLRKRNKCRECQVTPSSGYRLYDIAKCFEIPIGNAHNALMDAFTTAQLLQRYLPLLVEAGVRSIDDLAQIGAPFKGGDSFRLTNEFGNF